jgi:Chalcone isomerase-like
MKSNQIVVSTAKSKVFPFIASAGFVCAAAISVATSHARDLAGVTMPENVSISGKQLRLNGMGVGTKGFFKVYVIALYLETPTSDARTAIKADEVKRIVLTMLRDVSREKFVQAVEKDMMHNPGVPMAALRGRLDLLESVLPALKRGNVLDFTHLPVRGTLVRGQGREITIPGKDFADALFSIWLSGQSSNPALQHQLLGGA